MDGASTRTPLLLMRQLLICTAVHALSLPNIGIDLGTTNSAIAVLRSGTPAIVLNNGVPTTPSTVGFTPDGVLVGEVALGQAASNVQNTICSSKRFMGKRIKEVKLEASRVSFEVPRFCSAQQWT